MHERRCTSDCARATVHGSMARTELGWTAKDEIGEPRWSDSTRMLTPVTALLMAIRPLTLPEITTRPTGQVSGKLQAIPSVENRILVMA